MVKKTIARERELATNLAHNRKNFARKRNPGAAREASFYPFTYNNDPEPRIGTPYEKIFSEIHKNAHFAPAPAGTDPFK